MKTGMPWMIIGVSMFILGLILFYSMEYNENSAIIKNSGTFVGLTGIGVAVAGILLYLINRKPQPIQENYDIE
ncbi:hypothetical protein [Nitrosopumilus sp. Nsub]|uniref:hypothetical protein n=1 Tax=Nitrosopumilus sp. Nsub TaxID=1776294 RepID=UPI000835202E|nr:hypothetical protein [Nitrosopumilus sp. Nsub]